MRYSTPAGRWVIAATVLGSGMASIDATVVGIALPSIGRDFRAPLGTLQWVVTGYSLTLSALLLIGGSLGDHEGRRRLFMIGVGWFVAASAACALAPGASVLIVMRVLQGVGAALLTPGSLAIIEAAFDPEERGRAIGAWSGLSGVATAAGPLLGGYLVAASSWRLIFVINLPLGAVVLALSARHVPESRDPTATQHLDVPGAALTVVALAGLTYGLIEGPARGWDDASVVVMLAVGAVAGLAFLVVERASPAPMLPLEMFRRRQFTATNASTFVLYGALGGVLFLLPVELQVVSRYTAFQSGVSLLPLTVVMLLLSGRSGRLASRIGPRLQMSGGPVLVGLGLVLLSRGAGDSSYLSGVLPGMVVLGLGLAATVAPLTTTALSSVPEEHAGLASAVNNDVARLGGLIAVAVLPSLAGISGFTYLQPARLADGFRVAMLIAAGWCLGGGLISAVGIRNPEPMPAALRGGGDGARNECFHCALDATPMAEGS